MRSNPRPKPEPILRAICLLTLALCASGCSSTPRPGRTQQAQPFTRHFTMKEVDLLIVQNSARSTGKLPTTLTLTNVTDQPVCLLEVSIPDKSGNVTLYAPETVLGSYFYRKGRLSLRLEESDRVGEFMRTDAFLLPGHEYKIEHPLEDLNLRGRTFMVAYQIMNMASIEKKVFAPTAGEEEGKVYESIPRSRMPSLSDADLGEVICARAGRRTGYRCSVGPR